jgi:negative regulator of flagellin synthesis FlgM
MTINPIRSESNPIVSEKQAKTRPSGAETQFSDTLGVNATLSRDSAAVGALVAQAMEAASVRADKVAALRASVASGDYSIDPHAIAASMLQELRQ